MSVGTVYRSKAKGRRAGTLGRSSHVVAAIAHKTLLAWWRADAKQGTRDTQFG